MYMTIYYAVYTGLGFGYFLAFSALTLLVGWQEGHPGL